MTRAGALIESFYEDANLRGSLTDDEAEVLLQWASEQAERLATSGADDAAFDVLADRLRQLVERINWTAGEGSYATPEARAAALSAIAANAQAVGLTFLPSFAAQAAPADPLEALHGLLASLEPAAASAAPAEAAPPPATAFAAAVAPHEAAPLPPSTPADSPAPPALSVDDEEFYDL